MTKDEMSKVIGQALRSYDWVEYRQATLPDYLANAIAIREQETHKNDLRSELKDKTIKLDVANAEIDKLRMHERTHIENLEVLRRKLEEARAAAPHFYHPSTMHMGDCSICGGTADAPQHDVAQWEVRCKFAEATIAAIKEAIQ
jgi:hypothetical protein